MERAQDHVDVSLKSWGFLHAMGEAAQIGSESVIRAEMKLLYHIHHLM